MFLQKDVRSRITAVQSYLKIIGSEPSQAEKEIDSNKIL